MEVQVGILSMAISLRLIQYKLYLKELRESWVTEGRVFQVERTAKGLHRQVLTCPVLGIAWKAVCLQTHWVRARRDGRSGWRGHRQPNSCKD